MFFGLFTILLQELDLIKWEILIGSYARTITTATRAIQSGNSATISSITIVLTVCVHSSFSRAAGTERILTPLITSLTWHTRYRITAVVTAQRPTPFIWSRCSSSTSSTLRNSPFTRIRQIGSSLRVTPPVYVIFPCLSHAECFPNE